MRRAGFRSPTPLPPPAAVAHLRPPVAHRDPMSRSVQVFPHASPGGQVLLEAFQNVADWTITSGAPTLSTDDGSVSYQATNPGPQLPFPASKGLKVVTASGTAGVITKTISVNLANVKAIRLWTYSWDANSTTAPTINLTLSQDTGISNFYKASKNGGNVAGFGGVGGMWNMWTFPVGDFVPTGAPSWANTMVRLQIRISPGASNVGTYTLGMMTYELAAPQTVVCFGFDDCHWSIYRYAFPYMRSRGVRGTVFHVQTFADTALYMASNWLRELDAAGWDIGNHTYDHTFWSQAALTTAQCQAEASQCKTWLESLGLSRASMHLAFPSGECVNNGAGQNGFLALQNAGILSARSVQALNRQSLPLATPLYWNNTYSLGNTVTLAAAKAQVDTWLANGGVYMPLAHVLVDPPTTSTQWSPTDFMKLVDYVLGYNIPCLTISELWRLTQGQSVVVPRGAY